MVFLERAAKQSSIWLVQPFSCSSRTSSYSLCPRRHGPEGPPAQKMHMQVIHLLAAMRVAIDNQPITAFGDALLSRQITRHDEHMTDQRLIIVGNIICRGDGFGRHDQYMHRSSGA